MCDSLSQHNTFYWLRKYWLQAADNRFYISDNNWLRIKIHIKWRVHCTKSLSVWCVLFIFVLLNRKKALFCWIQHTGKICLCVLLFIALYEIETGLYLFGSHFIWSYCNMENIMGNMATTAMAYGQCTYGIVVVHNPYCQANIYVERQRKSEHFVPFMPYHTNPISPNHFHHFHFSADEKKKIKQTNTKQSSGQIILSRLHTMCLCVSVCVRLPSS